MYLTKSQSGLMCNNCASRVAKAVEKHFDSSLLNGSAKQRKKFTMLTKLDKRQWRESLQRAIAVCRNRNVSRALMGIKTRGKTARKIRTLSAREEHVLQYMEQGDLELQAGGYTAAVAAASALMGGISAMSVSRSISGVAQDMSRASNTANDMISTIVEKFTEFAESVKKIGGWLFKFAVAVVAYWLISRFIGASALVSAITAVALTFVPEGVEFFQRAAGVQSQSGFEGISSLLALACVFLVPSRTAPKYLGDFVRTVAFFPKLSDGLESFLEKSIKLIESFVNFVLRRDSTSWISLGRKITLIEGWRLECVDICSKFDTVAKPEREVILLAQKKVQEGYGFLQLLTGRESKREVSIWLDKVNSRLAPHLGSLASEHNVRPTPYCAMMGGESGVGKTSVVQAFASFVLLLAGEVRADEVLQNLWQKGISEYWNGYLGQRAIIKDDCFQVKGVAGAQDSEAMEIIRAVGNWACPLNFADVDSKGRYYLDVALIVGTTNAKNIKSDWEPFIANPEALVRRFQGAYWLELNDEFATPQGRYDFDKIQRVYSMNLKAFAERKVRETTWKPSVDDVLDLFPWHAWTVRLHGFDNSNPKQGSVFTGGLKAAVKLAAQTIRDRRESHVTTVDNLKEHLNAVQAAMDDIQLQAGGAIASPEITEDTWHGFDKVDIPPYVKEPIDPKYLNFKESMREMRAQLGPMQPIDMSEELADESWTNALKERVSEWSRSVYSYLGLSIPVARRGVMDTLAIGAALAVILGGVKILWGLVKAILTAFGITPKVVTQSNTPPAKEQKGLKRYDFPQVELQLGTPPTEGIHDAIYRNMYVVELIHKCDDTKNMFLGTALGIGDSVYLMPKHFVQKAADTERDSPKSYEYKMTLCYQPTHYVKMSMANFMKLRSVGLDDYDIVGMDFGRTAGLRANRNIVNYFLESHELANLMRGSNIPMRLDVARPSKEHKVVRNIMHSSGMEYAGTVVSSEGYKMRGCVKYQMPTLAGDCGGPLTIEENRFYGGRAIVGIHVAGRAGFFAREGYATLLPQQTVRDVWLMLSDYRDSSDDAKADILVSADAAQMVETQAGLIEAGIVGGSITYIGEVKEAFNISPNSAYKPSPMQSDLLFGVSPTRPAILHAVERDGELVYPMARAVEAYQSPVLHGDSEQLRIAADVAFRQHTQVTKAFPRDILSFEESIVPPEGWKLKALNRRSSAGYKYRKIIPNLARYPGKTYFLGFEGDVDFSNPNLDILREHVQGILVAAKRGERTLHVFTDFLKDELRPLEKVENVKTRMISGAELDYTLAVRMYFGAFQAAMLATPVVSGMSPGVNHYTQWNGLAEGLLSKGGSVFDGDFSRFDASEQPWVHEAILAYINRWYAKSPSWKEEDDRVRTVLWQDLIHSRHLTGVGCQLKYLVQWHKSLPSGHPLTTTVNSMYSLLTLTCCYMKLTGDNADMWDHVFINTFGDDNVVGVDGLVREEFNQVTVGPTMQELFGLTYTPGVKDGVPVKYTDIENIVYLQRSFLVDEDKESLLINCPNVGWVAPLNFKSFLYTPYWFKDTRDPVGDLERNCEILVCELALHPKEVWDEKFPILERWCSDNDIPLRFVNREAARTHVKTRLDVWF